MNIRVIHHDAVSIKREANKIATVFKSSGHNVVLEPQHRTSNRQFDFNLVIGNNERFILKRFGSMDNTLLYLTAEGITTYEKINVKAPIVTVSKHAKNLVEMSGYRVEDVVHHGFDLNWFNLSEANRPRLFGKRYMFMLHKIWTERSRTDLIIKAIQLFMDKYKPDVSFLDLGKPALVMSIKPTPYSASYMLYPYLPDEFVVGSYKASDSYIHLSTSEGFGLTLLEALGCGIPSIYVDAPPMNELVYKGYGYPVPYVKEDWLYIPRYPEFKFKEYYFDSVEASEILYKAYERKNQYVDKGYINNFDMFKLYPKLLEWCKQYVRA